MEFNLIEERWIPICRKSGREEQIAPWEITDSYESDPVISLSVPRPDFNGALIQFLIGLVQTTTAPKDEDEWEDCFDTPPSPNKLKVAFETVKHAFNLGGNGARFMQDFDAIETTPQNISGLLIDSPGENTLKNNADHFIKRGNISCMCPSCAATALFALQTNAPAGGVGYRVSLRGGGPLTTLVVGGSEEANSLWQTVWLNIVEKNEFLRICCDSKKKDDPDMFPWMAKTRTSEKHTGHDTTPEDINPAQMFWGMPRRIRLNIDDANQGMCDICGSSSKEIVDTYITKNHGVNYVGPFLHPLSPHSRQDGVPFPVHAQPGGVTYRHWLGLVQADKKNNREPALVVNKFVSRQRSDWPLRLWAFGYDMDNMKARCWYESTMPLLPLEKELREGYEDNIASMVMAASEAVKNLRSCVKAAWFKRTKDKKGDMNFLSNCFWQKTEDDFYTVLSKLKAALEEGDGSDLIRQDWHKCICRTALSLFDEAAWNGPIEDADPKRVVLARQELERKNNSKKIREELLDLPE
ncbi:MAG: type I-E CRISPR-associated protein Cse1/CasA [Deltaproteobacteria bacterium]|nr:type I-E CRISPR-associated protein Cse1/CasA [Deltaproteobacteria bacterium]MBN2845166.1 type I-E CRISPR-associated protein Cse1/CasA [Deltaproteobacteria bacterium]